MLLKATLLLTVIRCHEIIAGKIDKASKILRVPGSAIGVINAKGDILFETCTGYLKFGDHIQSVNSDSLFRIGSISKSLTSYMIARLVENHYLRWDDRLDDKVGELSTFPGYLNFTFRQALSMTSGMPEVGILQLLGNSDKVEDRLNELYKIKPTATIGEKFQYSNHVYAAAGYAAAHLYRPDLSLEQAFKAAMTDFVYKPLGMMRTCNNLSSADEKNICFPHALNVNGEVMSLKLHEEAWLDTLQPAGSILSSLHDMLKFIHAGLSSKSPEVESRIQEHIVVNENASYGMGVAVRKNLPYGTMFGHRGETLGFCTSYLFSRDLGIGIVILANKKDSADFLDVAELVLLEYFLNGIEIDIEEMLEAKRLAKVEVVVNGAARLEKTCGLYNLELFCGKYFHNEQLGFVKFNVTNQEYFVRIGAMNSKILPGKGNETYCLISPWALSHEICFTILSPTTIKFFDSVASFIFTQVEM